MARVRLSKGKADRLAACANAQGVFTALAVDHRTPLAKAIAAARLDMGSPARGADGQVTREDMIAFKSAVTRILSPYASAVLLDPEYSLGVIPQRAPHTGLMLAYEKTGYDPTTPGRLPDLLPTWSVRRLAEAGADGLKILLYFNPFDTDEINEVKRAYVERIGAECAALEMPFFLEPVAYDDRPGLAALEFARRKPDYVLGCVQQFADPRYGVDVLKVQVPVDPQFVAGTVANAGQPTLFTHEAALAHLRAAMDASPLPLIFLSGGAGDAAFLEALDLAGQAGGRFAGVACGRATWQDGVTIYAREGLAALEAWLASEGKRRIEAFNQALASSASPWWTAFD